MSETKRIQIMRAMIGICHMSVCAPKDATDEEILEVCNRENIAGTTNGWAKVIRENEPDSEFWPMDKLRPVQCADDANRQHIVCSC